jgi:hypothetical protein
MFLPAMGAVLLHTALAALLLLAVAHPPGTASQATTEVALVVEPAAAPLQPDPLEEGLVPCGAKTHRELLFEKLAGETWQLPMTWCWSPRARLNHSPTACGADVAAAGVTL